MQPSNVIFNCPIPSILKFLGWLVCLALCFFVPSLFFGTWTAFDFIYTDEIPKEHNFHAEAVWENSDFQYVGMWVAIAYAATVVCVVLFILICCLCRSNSSKPQVVYYQVQDQNIQQV